MLAQVAYPTCRGNSEVYVEIYVWRERNEIQKAIVCKPSCLSHVLDHGVNGDIDADTVSCWCLLNKDSSGEKDRWDDKLSDTQIVGWEAASAAGLQSNGCHVAPFCRHLSCLWWQRVVGVRGGWVCIGCLFCLSILNQNVFPFIVLFVTPNPSIWGALPADTKILLDSGT